MMNIYDKKGYLDVKALLSVKVPFIICTGARGIGKTFSSLNYAEEEDLKFIYMRRTQKEVDTLTDPNYQPFKSINEVKKKHIGINGSSFYHQELNDDNKWVNVGEPIGYIMALSTFATFRGFDSSDVKLLIYDEFSPEKHVRPIKNEASAFLNAYETINRNRELEGQQPVQTLLLANSNDLANAIYIELGLVSVLEKMKKQNQWIYINKERGLAVFLIDKSPISEKKKDTALYRLVKDSDFSKMAIENEFSSNEMGKIKSRNLKQFKPIVFIGELAIYEHKSEHEYYISLHKQGTAPTYGSGDIERERFLKNYSWLWDSYIYDHITFEEYICEVLFEKYFGM